VHRLAWLAGMLVLAEAAALVPAVVLAVTEQIMAGDV
jgi:hypothetical protein